MRKLVGNLLKDQARWAGRARQEAAWREGGHGHDSMKYSSELRFSGGDLGISEEEVLEGPESANAYSTLSLDVPDTDDESPAVAYTLEAEEEALEGVEYRESLKPLLENLPPHEKRILLLRFFSSMTQSQIART